MCSLFSKSTQCLNHYKEKDMPHILGSLNISIDNLLSSWKTFFFLSFKNLEAN